MAELMTAVNELLKGKRVEENADIYCDGIETLYKSSAYVKLCMNYHIFSEVYEEIEDDEKNVIQPVVARIQTLVGNLVDCNDIDAGLIEEAESIRERLVNVMEILTAHADRLQIFEYMLNRIEFRFRNEPFDSTYYNDGFERDIERYVLSDRDNAVINMKITQMVSQLPMRLSQNRFFNIIENSLSIYKGSERSSLDDFVYMIKTAGTLFRPANFEDEFDEILSIEKELSGLDYDSLDKTGYEKARMAYDKVSVLTERYSDACVMLTQVINDLYSIMLCAGAATDDEERNDLIRKIITADYNIVNGNAARSGDEETMLARLEGVQESISRRLYTPDSTLDEIININYDIMTRTGLISRFDKLKTVSRLQSASTFAVLEDVQVDKETVDDEYAAKAAGNLIEEFKKLFDGGSRLKRRAVMASVVGSLPVFFNNFDEFKDYVHISLMQCSDEAERQAVLALAKILISGD